MRSSPLLQLILLPRYSGRLTNSGRYATHSTVRNGMSRLEPSRNTRRTWTWTWMFFQYHLLPANQIKGTRSQSQSMDALGRPRIALCKNKCEIWRAPADEHLVVGWHIDDIGHRPSRHHTAVVPVHLLDRVASNVARQGTTLVFSWTPRISTT